MLVNKPISLYNTNAIRPASSPIPAARNDISTMRNCAGSAILTSPTCPPVAAIVAGRGSALLLLSGILISFSRCLTTPGPQCIGAVGALHSTFEGSDQRRPSHLQFGLVMERELAQNLFALWSQGKKPLATIFASAMAPHVTARGQPVHQFDRAVMLNLQPLRQFADPGPRPRGHTFKG